MDIFDNFRVPQIPCALELCLERQNNPYMYIGKFYLFILIAKCACFARMFDEIVVQNFQSVQKFSAFFLNTII